MVEGIPGNAAQGELAGPQRAGERAGETGEEVMAGGGRCLHPIAKGQGLQRHSGRKSQNRGSPPTTMTSYFFDVVRIVDDVILLFDGHFGFGDVIEIAVQDWLFFTFVFFFSLDPGERMTSWNTLKHP